jgi:hypothetical protein
MNQLFKNFSNQIIWISAIFQGVLMASIDYADSTELLLMLTVMCIVDITGFCAWRIFHRTKRGAIKILYYVIMIAGPWVAITLLVI